MKRIETGIYRKRDGRLYVRTTAKDPYTGKMVERQETLEEGKGLADARRIRRELKAEIAAKRDHSGPDVQSVEDYAAWWLKQKTRELGSPASRQNYLYALERLCEHMGGLGIRDVVRADLQKWVGWAESLTHEVPPERWLCPQPDVENLSASRTRIVETIHAEGGELELRDVVRSARTTRTTVERMIDAGELVERRVELPPEPYSHDSLRTWWRIILIMFRDAVADGLLDTDPTTRVRPPASSVRNVQERDTLSARELGEFVDAASRVAPDRYAEIVTLAYTGMRAGELYGLMWEDVDWAGERLHIRRTVSRRKLRDTTKTGAQRETYMPKIVAEAIRDHHERRLRADNLHELVFPADSGNPRAADTLRRSLDAATAEAGIEITVRPQVLRRTFNTLLVGAGIDRIVQRSMIGHTTEQMTERYAGVRLEAKRAAVLSIVPQEND